ncbi:hypothetical protein [Duganella vulcania]|uniref:Uncharacterized protein n=1 Tax=Duganella vulcania TaxID=2692166 RepID=A0A845GLT9_9BURK|nr:hypothetical protein [Duganella vulcania]MYM95244.1 hypothetical protein [Duganella vulcania]
MKSAKSKWLAYTVIVGLIPIVARMLTWLVTSSGRVAPFTASDFVAFGLVLHISVFNELEHASIKGAGMKNVLNSISLLFITLYGVLCALNVVAERDPGLVDPSLMFFISAGFSMASMALGVVAFYYLPRVKER